MGSWEHMRPSSPQLLGRRKTVSIRFYFCLCGDPRNQTMRDRLLVRRAVRCVNMSFGTQRVTHENALHTNLFLHVWPGSTPNWIWCVLTRVALVLFSFSFGTQGVGSRTFAIFDFCIYVTDRGTMMRFDALSHDHSKLPPVLIWAKTNEHRPS